MISVVIPVYNGARFLAHAVRSVIGQTLPPDEIIIVDDGSSDNSVEIADSFGSNVRVLRFPHRGASAALNAGISVVNGDMLAFLDADDFWASDKLAFQAALLAGDSTLDAVFGGIVTFSDPDCAISGPDEIQQGKRAQVGASKNAMLIRRSAFDRVGPFDETMAVSEFTQWYPRAIRSEIRVQFPDRVVAFRRVHRTNITRLLRDEVRREYLQIAREAIASRAPTAGG